MLKTLKMAYLHALDECETVKPARSQRRNYLTDKQAMSLGYRLCVYWGMKPRKS
jgi:hypothetical protein